MRARAACAILGLTLTCGAGAQTPPPEVQLHYQERPPYYESGRQSQPRGLVIAPLEKALRLSGLPHRFVQTPALRQIELIERGDALVCGVGWFQTPERSLKGRFSKMLYQDRPLGMLVHARTGWTLPRAMAEALGDTRVRLLVKAGYSYGPDFDRLLTARAAPPLTLASEAPALARMLLGDRADWTPMAPEEAETEAAGTNGELRALAFSDAPPGNRRYLYCNKAVPEEWLARLDAALASSPQR